MKQETVLINAWGLLWFKLPNKYSELEITLNVKKSWLWLASGMRSYLFENKIIEEWIHLLRLKSHFKGILAVLLSLKALLITKVVREVQHILLADSNSGRGNSGRCHRGIQMGISHAHTHQNKTLLTILRNMGLNTFDLRIYWQRDWVYT